MTPIVKYPRTPHVAGSCVQPGDHDLDIVPAGRLAALSLIVEEKLDGSNCGISFDASDGLVLQSRGHVLTGGPRERQFDLLKRWANHHSAVLHRILGRRYIVYGEWLFARHTIAYDRLPHYFLEFDILDREAGEFLSTARRRALLEGGPVVSVPVLATGVSVSFERLTGPSTCSSTEWMEGLYLKHEAEGRVIGRYKYVRAQFRQTVDESGEHWMERPLVPNRLLPGVDLFS